MRLVLDGLDGFASTGVPDEWVGLVVPDQFQSRYYTVRSFAGHHQADPLVRDARRGEVVEAVEHQPDEVVRQRFTTTDGRLELGCGGAHPTRLAVAHQCGRIGKSDRPSAWLRVASTWWSSTSSRSKPTRDPAR